MEAVNWVLANYQVILANLVLIISALIAIFLLIPGPSPEKELQKVLDFISKFSKK